MIRWILIFWMGLLATGALPAMAGEAGLLAGPKSGTYEQMARDLKAYVRSDLVVHTSSGSVENLMRLQMAPTIQMAFVQQDALDLMRSLKLRGLERIKLVCPLFREEVHLLVGRESAIGNPADLADRRVGAGPRNSGTWITALNLKRHLKVNWSEENSQPEDALKQLLGGKLDALFWVVGAPAPALTALSSESGARLRLVPLPPDVGPALYRPERLPAGIYTWQKMSWQTLTVRTLLVAMDRGKPEADAAVRDMAAGIRRHLATLREKGHPKWRQVDPDDRTDMAWPRYPGLEGRGS